ncbi:MAG TPA: Rieske 2Fe-2S domain-containing protein, partial [Actinomycetota bacterium]|nr:Rieske 2Fe-2S domain-containing protein [Actinomycetota bacterium]
GPKSGTATGGGGAAGGSPAGGRGRVISNLSDLRVGQAVEFRDPSSGRPAVLLRPRDDDVVAYSRICTHAGCTVAFDPGLDLLTCPCHGSVFDPARGAAVVAGPAPRPLARIPLEINRESGDIVAQ